MFRVKIVNFNLNSYQFVSNNRQIATCKCIVSYCVILKLVGNIARLNELN